MHCYEVKKLDYCECGKEPWETPGWCDMIKRGEEPIPPEQTGVDKDWHMAVDSVCNNPECYQCNVKLFDSREHRSTIKRAK